MKNVYKHSVNPCGKTIKKSIAQAMDASKAGVSQLRGNMAVILVIFFILNSTVSVMGQNCPTIGNHTQNINENTYYPATASASSGSTSISLGTAGSGANFGSTPIATGDIVLVIQMQGAQINVPASTTSSLYGGNNSGKGSGFLSTNMVAGTMEFAVAKNPVPLAGGVLTISAGLTYSYVNAAYGANGQYTYQVIRVPSYFNIQLTGTITTPEWNGSVGGVTVISAVNQLDFNSQSITALGAGFRGGGGINKTGAAGTLLDYYTMSTNNANASKGEGIAGTPRYMNFNFTLVDNVVEGYPGGSFAKGAPGNGGGGSTDSNPPANDKNAGGGGGGNGGSGGRGGNGWLTFGVSGGFGGSSFGAVSPVVVANYASPSVLIMGGGGGAGDTNNSTGSLGALSSSGASGGGIVIVNALTMMGSGNINVSGTTFDKTVINDGSGGGGAGGSILIYANSGQNGITATANGGNGINNYPFSASATQHGPGGGGGGGVIYSNAAINIASTVTPGTAGISQGSTATNSFNATDGNPGIMTTTFPFSQLPPNMEICQSSVLPVTILSFTANYVSANNVKVAWTTTNEINAAYFEVERSSDGTSFMSVAQVNTNESASPVHSYSINDQLYNINSNVVYYRLRIVDNDGKYTYSNIIPVKLDQPENILSVYPNPVDNYAVVNLFTDQAGSGMLRLIDDSGRQILIKSFTVTNGNNSMTVDQLGNLPKGIYIIQVLINNNQYIQKIVKK
jgi:hypothetical protein